jgi:hypothetical protein
MAVSGSPITSSGTFVVTATTSGANSIVLRDTNQNVTANDFYEGFTNVTAAGTTTVLTASSAPNFVVTGSGGQTYQLPDATTLPAGAIYTFNNNQSSGTIVVKNNSGTTIATLQSGSYIEIILLSNSIAAGTWDYHNQAPSNASWSTNTLNWAGTYSGGTWNGNVITGAYGGTGVNNGTSTITIGGNVTMSGAYTFTGTLTGNTAVTFPTSGTLVNTAVTTLSSLSSVGTITTGTWNANIVAPTYGGTGVNNGTNTLTLAGNLTTAGAYAQTLTATATTSVTLPTSGTLISSSTALPGAVTGTPSSTTYLRGDGTWATVTAGVSQIIAGSNITISPTGGTGNVTINASVASGTYNRTSFTATASQTTFSVTYTVGYVEVFLNGVLLNASDYTASSGTSVVLAVGANSGDILETIAYNVVSLGTATSSTNISGGAAGEVVYQTGSGATGFTAVGTTGQVLISNGTSAPTWSTLSYPSLSSAQTWTATQTFNGSTSTFGATLLDSDETVNVVAAAPSSTTNFYIQSGSVQYYTTSAANNWTLNIAFSSGTSLNTALSTGQSVTFTLITTQGSTAYYNSAVTIDGTSVTPKWIGAAPSAGNASGLDVYRFAVVKTGSATYTVLASLTQYK